MPKFTKAIAGLAVTAAVTGGAIAMSATAASANGNGNGNLFGLMGGMPPMQNNFFPPIADFGNDCNNNIGNGGFGPGFGNGYNNNDNNMFWNNQNMWNQSAFTDNVDDNSGFAIIGRHAAIAFHDKTNRNTNWFNNGWNNNNMFWNNRNNNNYWNNPGFGGF